MSGERLQVMLDLTTFGLRKAGQTKLLELFDGRPLTVQEAYSDEGGWFLVVNGQDMPIRFSDETLNAAIEAYKARPKN